MKTLLIALLGLTVLAAMLPTPAQAYYLRDCLRGAPCPGFNARSLRYAPRERYYDRSPYYAPRERYYDRSPYYAPRRRSYDYDYD